MKSKSILYLAALLMMALVYSCQPEEPDDNQPVDDPRLKYTGSWLCSEVGGQTYNVTINLDSSNSTQVKLYNFHHLGFEEMVRGIVAGSTVTLPNQTACLGTLTIEGTGTITTSGNTINFVYSVDDQANLDTIQAIYSKQ